MTPQPAKPRVLIVDDTPANRVAFESVLERDYTITVASSGSEALKLAAEKEFAVILLDVRMPVMDGFETAELLRKRERTQYTPIVFMSAYDQSVIQVKRGYVAGATDFIFSPVDEELLKFKVSTFAQLFLRNEAMRLQIEKLTAEVQELKVEVDKRYPPDEELKDKVTHVEAMIQELQRQMSPASS